MSGPKTDQDITPSDIEATDLDDLTQEDLEKIPRTRRHLSRLRVSELRHITRSECGSGSWISRASKDDLIEGALQGKPPRSTHKEDRGREPTKDSLRRTRNGDGSQTTQEAYAGEMGRSLLDVMLDLTMEMTAKIAESDAEDFDKEDARKAIRESLYNSFSEDMGESVVGTVVRVTNQIVERKLKMIDDRITRIEEELGVDTGEVGFSKDEVRDLFKKNIRESKEAERRAKERVDNDLEETG